MRIVVVAVEEVNVVGGDYADGKFFSEFQHPVDDALLSRIEIAEIGDRPGRQRFLAGNRLGALPLAARVQHHLQRIIVAEKIFVPKGDALGLVHPSIVDGGGDFACDARRRAVQPFVVFLQQRMVDTSVVVKAVDVRFGNKLDEIVVAGQVLGVQTEVESPLGFVAGFIVAGGSNVHFAAENRLYPLLAALVIERFEREKVAVVGDGERVHPQFFRLGDERLYLALSV